jgi:hypothetical protein
VEEKGKGGWKAGFWELWFGDTSCGVSGMENAVHLGVHLGGSSLVGSFDAIIQLAQGSFTACVTGKV